MGKHEADVGCSLSRANERAARALDEIDANVAVLNREGVIIATNRTWREFAAANRLADGSLPKNVDIGSNYLDICLSATGPVTECARAVHAGIRAVLNGRRSSYCQEYPCHAPTRQRWFSMTVKPVRRSSPREVVVIHVDVTDRYQAEIAAQAKQAALSAALAELHAMAGKIRHSVVKASMRQHEPLIPHLDKTSREHLSQRLASLSKREMEVFMALAHGERNTEIAGRLQLSNKSISTYRARVLEKLCVDNNAQLVRLSSEAGLIAAE